MKFRVGQYVFLDPKRTTDGVDTKRGVVTEVIDVGGKDDLVRVFWENSGRHHDNSAWASSWLVLV